MIQILTKFECEILRLYEKGYNYVEMTVSCKMNEFFENERDNGDCKKDC